MKISYLINNLKFQLKIDNINKYEFGKNEILSKKYNDILLNLNKGKGFKVFKNDKAFNSLKIEQITSNCIKKIIKKTFPNIDLKKFDLKKYHHYVNDIQHKKIISKTRRLYPKDFGINEKIFLNLISNKLKKKFKFKNPFTKKKHWIIVRINRPNSNDFNPVHKDIYESYDKLKQIASMINIWIPICGVDKNSGLPIAPKSHLISEDKILRSKANCVVNNIPYSVNNILSWNNDNKLIRISPKKNEILIFSSFLIHGLSINNNLNTTRVSFELRVYG